MAEKLAFWWMANLLGKGDAEYLTVTNPGRSGVQGSPASPG